jgi:iron complex outermembrane receptor protein
VQPNDSIYQVTQGNRALQPEISNSTAFGVIFQPRFLPGFAASVDYYDTKITNAITSPTAQQVVNECALGVSALCAQIVRNSAGAISTVYIQPVNLASQVARGMDFEASYRRSLNTIATFLPGNFGVRLLATHYLQNTINTGIAGVTPSNYVGDNSGNGTYGTTSLPHWKYAATATWDNGPVALTFTARGFSDGVINSTYIQCTAACPAATANNPTISNNFLPGAIYFDANISYRLPRGIESYVSVDNLANTPPVMVPYGPSIGGAPLSINPNLYDTLGRTLRMGFRFKM